MKENNEKVRVCCFVGHRKIKITSDLVEKLTKTIETLIKEKEINTFYFGSKSEFDTLCHEVVTTLKEKYPHINRVYVRSAYQYIDEGYRNYLLGSYEDTYFPSHIANSGKACHPERNIEMIDRSEVCVFYYDSRYVPPRKDGTPKFNHYQAKSGTALAFRYAQKKKKNVINLAH